jgi:hypothetical protein
MAVLERDVEQPVVKWARANGIKIKKKMPGDQLDRWFMLPGGRVFIIEFKKPGGKLTPLQAKEISELQALGYDVEVHNDSEKAIRAIEKRIK